MKALYPDLPTEENQPAKATAFGRVIERLRLGRGIKIHGVEGLMVRYAQCCQPVPGDPVVGYVTQGRGISVHRTDCPNLLTLSGDMERRVGGRMRGGGGGTESGGGAPVRGGG